MATKPTGGHLDWVTDDDPAKFIAPSSAKKLQGWTANEKPPFQYFNWLFRLVDRWLKWAEAQADENAAAIATNAAAIISETNTRISADADHAALTGAHGATATPQANRPAMFTSGGRLQSAAAPVANNDLVRKLDHTLAGLGVTVSAAALNRLGLVYTGRVGWAGTAGNPFPSGWSVSKIGTGQYRITCNLNAYFNVVASHVDGSYGVAKPVTISVNYFDVAVYDASGAPKDGGFCFILMG